MQKRSANKTEQQPSIWKWLNQETLIYGDSGVENKELIAGFDMDDTLITTKSGARFAKNATDWQWWNPVVVKTLQDLSKKGFKVVIFTNQNGIAKGHSSAKDIQSKIEQLQKDLDIPLTALIASGEDQYRKPNLGMWNFFVDIMNGKVKIDLDKSFYCGDAAGRVKGKKKDFSDTDLKFALNIGLTFKTPEQQFLNQDLNENYTKNIGFDPKSIPKSGSLIKGENIEKLANPEKPEMIIMIGSVGSGKSTFVQNNLSTYVRINRDTLKTKEKCLAKAEECIKANQYLVIDNTNPKQEDRKIFIDLAKKYNYPVRAFYIEVTKDLCMHNDSQREINKHRKHLSGKVGKIPIHSFFKNFEMPTNFQRKVKDLMRLKLLILQLDRLLIQRMKRFFLVLEVERNEIQNSDKNKIFYQQRNQNEKIFLIFKTKYIIFQQSILTWAVLHQKEIKTIEMTFRSNVRYLLNLLINLLNLAVLRNNLLKKILKLTKIQS